MTPAKFRDAVLAEWKASPEDSMGPSLDRVLARMLADADETASRAWAEWEAKLWAAHEETEARAFWRGVCFGVGDGIHAGTYGATEDNGCDCVGCQELRGVIAQLRRWAEEG